MKTIKTKIFLIFSIFMVSLVALGIFLNSIFLESYYIYKNKGILKSISEKINNEYINDKENSYEYINTIENIENISTTIVDQDFNIEYNSVNEKRDTNQKNRLSKEMKQIILDNKKKLLKNFVYYTEEKNNAQN